MQHKQETRIDNDNNNNIIIEQKSIFLLLNHVNVCYMLIHISALHKQINLCTKVGDEGIHGCAHERMRQMARTHTYTQTHTESDGLQGTGYSARLQRNR